MPALQRCLRLFALASTLLIPGVSGAEMDAEARERKANAIARQVMSPFCPGRTLWGCPSPNAAEWREDIRTWVGEGLTAEEIRARLEKRAPGFDLSGAPSTSLGWGLPALLALMSVGLLAFVLSRLVRRGSAATPVARTAPEGTSATTEGDAELDARLDAELDREEG